MTKLEKIERDVEALEAEEFARFRAWFAAFDAARWDQEIADDAALGHLDAVADEALAAHCGGRTRPL